MSQARKIRDPIHQFVEINSRECDILDTPLLQRLRRIRQLAMASLVYPGAVHTQFDHTLGVLGITGRLCSRLEIGWKFQRRQGSSAIHGPHQAAQKSSSTYLPLKSESLNSLPSMSRAVKSGAGVLPSKICGFRRQYVLNRDLIR